MSNPFAGASVRPSGLEFAEHRGWQVQVNLPKALKSRSVGVLGEGDQPLPPHAQVQVYDVAQLAGAPASWKMRDPLYRSFVFGVPETEDKGLWLDFNANLGNYYHSAVLVSCQGVNALTGERTDNFELKARPGQTPAQNYLASNSGRPFWLDGFSNDKGIVRQFVFTRDVLRGVAQNLIGDAKAQAFGVAFFRSKVQRPRPQMWRTRGCGGATFSMDETTRGMSLDVGAGARIQQEIGTDHHGVDFWEQEPAAVIVLHFVPETVLREMLGRPRQSEGFLSGLPVGH